ncbi:MAG: hypothetical protein CMF48_00355 [Legionellales bacterium]|nr:hypothetical protein [Legionellales bacterium]
METSLGYQVPYIYYTSPASVDFKSMPLSTSEKQFQKAKTNAVIAWSLTAAFLTATIVAAVFLWPVSIALAGMALTLLALGIVVELDKKQIQKRLVKPAAATPAAKQPKADPTPGPSFLPHHTAAKAQYDEPLVKEDSSTSDDLNELLTTKKRTSFRR